MDTEVTGLFGRRALAAAGEKTTQTLSWQIALWERSSVNPAILRVSLVVIVFTLLWAADVAIFERCRVQYQSALAMKGSPLAFTTMTAVVLAVVYTVLMHVLTAYGVNAEIAQACFYTLLFIFCFIMPVLFAHSNVSTPVFSPVSTSSSTSSSPKRGGDIGSGFSNRTDGMAVAAAGDCVSASSSTGASIGYYQMFIEHRASFLRLLRLVFFPGNSISFAEIVLADALTSLSKVFKDLGVTAIALYAAVQGKPMVLFHEEGMLLVALLASLPAFLRVRQCWVQFVGTDVLTTKVCVMLNIIKYCTAFPPIWLATATSLGYSHPVMPTAIISASIINSLYSYVWDISMDWGLVQLSFPKSTAAVAGSSRPSVAFRSVHFYPIPVYVLAVALNFMLRFGWMANQVPSLQNTHPSTIVFLVELLEVFRRAVWNLFRVEWEIVAKNVKGPYFKGQSDVDDTDEDVGIALVKSSSSGTGDGSVGSAGGSATSGSGGGSGGNDSLSGTSVLSMGSGGSSSNNSSSGGNSVRAKAMSISISDDLKLST